jgi:hypothetical protein
LDITEKSEIKQDGIREKIENFLLAVAKYLREAARFPLRDS